MTRKQVAVRLGKSLATVRRLEGVLLNPRLDHRGVHRFDPDEVDALAADVEDGRVRLSDELLPAPASLAGGHMCQQCAELKRELAALRNELRQQRRQHSFDVHALRDEHAAATSRLEAEAGTLVAELNDFLETLDR